MKDYKVLFVCLGNVCRSPAAEGIFKKMIKEQGLENKITVDSAGTSGYHEGELPDSRMRQHAARRGYKLDSLSRRFSRRDFDRFDIILAMDDNNYHNLKRLAINLESEKKIYKITDFSQRYSHDHIPDPYYSGSDGFELVLDLLEDTCEGLFERMKKSEI